MKTLSEIISDPYVTTEATIQQLKVVEYYEQQGLEQSRKSFLFFAWFVAGVFLLALVGASMENAELRSKVEVYETQTKR